MKKARGACATGTQSGATGSKGALQFLNADVMEYLDVGIALIEFTQSDHHLNR